MADGHDAANAGTHGESTSGLSSEDQSLHHAMLATATSGELKLADRHSSAGAAEPIQLESTCDQGAISPSPLSADEVEVPAASSRLELTDLRLELAQLRQTLEEEQDDVEEGDPARTTAATATVDEEDNAIVEYRVIDFAGGLYRGQVQAFGPSDQKEWRPHGLGVLTTATIHTRCGQWVNGTQVHYGTRYSPTLRYEGDVGVGSTSTRCHGVGLYTFGVLFVGCWVSASRRYPHGLGSLQSATDACTITMISVDGWFHGLQCVHPPVHKCIFKLSSDARSQPQPQRGLMVADEKLQFWRRHALTRALSAWIRVCCDFNITQARQSRLLALQTQAHAREAEQRAISANLERHKADKNEDATELLTLLARSREAQEQRFQRRQLYAQRLASAIQQRDLARACVAKQDSAVKVLETELQDVSNQLKRARQAEDDCAQYARDLHVLKRQIENASVKVNAARFDQRQQASQVETQEQEPQSSLSQRSILPTPIMKTPRARDYADENNSVQQSRLGSTRRSVTLGQQFVCGVPGCMCGIPRDVFLRVAGALNDE
ncbi:hypothetical protein GN958_ATG20563 [Phytophthora infestans]|uniref:Uncharacterized protein n=1 Tax=Phytophthora infestans TaxID=4787 RepID=A0A8S9TW62_PHYIN|nr:hypothetical protein GN958_ATG20563 [Phytophthora infestans]KAI9997639.1 hypothetical protein PInf_001570 [Phytophthora infestans]